MRFHEDFFVIKFTLPQISCLSLLQVPSVVTGASDPVEVGPGRSGRKEQSRCKRRGSSKEGSSVQADPLTLLRLVRKPSGQPSNLGHGTEMAGKVSDHMPSVQQRFLVGHLELA